MIDALRLASRNMHTPQQLARKVTPATPPSFSGFSKYMAETREVHRVLHREFPIRPRENFVEALDTDLWFLELEAWNADLPMFVQEPYSSNYAKYLDELPKHKLGCHWYNLLFAHLVGGNRVLAETASSVLPKGWIASSEFFQIPGKTTKEETFALQSAFEKEALTWTKLERQECLDETPLVFEYATDLNAFIFK